MFNTQKFGGYLSRLRKKADMTQSEVAEKLNLTRQAVSRYETGDSFPDVSILVLIADIFGVTLEDLINSGEPTRGESRILNDIAVGKEGAAADSIGDIMGLAPLLKPSVLAKLSSGLSKQGIDISSIVTLAEYLSDESVAGMLENATLNSVSDELLEKLMTLLDDESVYNVFSKILIGEMDWHLLKIILPYTPEITSMVEAAVVEGVLPQLVVPVEPFTLHNLVHLHHLPQRVQRDDP